ncbi:MAG: hypothetical protein APR63_03625 [Desulfuromonas sp. SDB]|nr:MAG: hypothetical protein APR63_03625 [Desulfuromonas sp. SDB]
MQKILEDEKKLVNKYGYKQAIKITQRINELEAAMTLNDIQNIKAAGLHCLSGKYKNSYAIKVINPYRIRFTADNGMKEDMNSITEITVIEIIDYH